MPRARLTIAIPIALALLWAGAAGAAPAAAESVGPSAPPAALVGAAGPTTGSAAVSGLTNGQRKARSRALRKCRKAHRKVKRKRCLRKVRKRYRAIARASSPRKPVAPKPKPAVKVHEVIVLDHVFDPDRLTIKSGEAIRFTWDDHNKDAHNITLREHPAGVDPLDFELGSAPSQGMRFQRTFKLPGFYRLACSLHHLQTIDVTVTP